MNKRRRRSQIIAQLSEWSRNGWRGVAREQYLLLEAELRQLGFEQPRPPEGLTTAIKTGKYKNNVNKLLRGNP